MGELELGSLAEKANAEHRACESAANAAVEHAMNAGEHLARVKASLAHGEFLPWLEANFEGSRRTASAYIRLSDNREALNGKRASHSIRGALAELSSPLEEKPEPAPPEPVEQPGPAERDLDVSSIREVQERFMGFWSDAEREAFERILSDPGPLEEELLETLGVADIKLLAAQVTVDGFLFEDAEEGDLPAISYRAPLGKPAKEKREIVKLSIPVADAMKEDADVAECVKRGCWQLGLLELKAWRAIHNWFARALAADPRTDMEVWEKRVAHNADWRQLDPACEFLAERTFHPEITERRWVKDQGLKARDFHTALELAEWLAGDYAERIWVNVAGEDSTRAERLERWKCFEVSA
jgi:hypothetical protein